MRRAARVDTVQQELVLLIRRLGGHVLHLHTVGAGCPDAVVALRRNHEPEWQTVLAEFKTRNGKLNAAQESFHAAWPGEIRVLRDADDVLAMFAGKVT